MPVSACAYIQMYDYLTRNGWTVTFSTLIREPDGILIRRTPRVVADY